MGLKEWRKSGIMQIFTASSTPAYAHLHDPELGNEIRKDGMISRGLVPGKPPVTRGREESVQKDTREGHKSTRN